MKFSVNIGMELRCSDCRYYKPFDNRYGTCTYKMENELDRLGLHQRSRKICHDFRSSDNKTVKQIMLSKFGDEILAEIEQDLDSTILGVDVANRVSLIDKESVPLIVKKCIDKVVIRETCTETLEH